jgi:hypothetical protein
MRRARILSCLTFSKERKNETIRLDTRSFVDGIARVGCKENDGAGVEGDLGLTPAGQENGRRSIHGIEAG